MSWIPGQQMKNRPYVVERELGRGGFGITYKVCHRDLNLYSVIKTPNDHLRHDPEYDKYVKRFIKEGQRLASLCADPHPHIVRVSDLFEEDNTYCLVMDFIPGESLWKLVQQQGALPEAQALKYICQIGDALTFVHQAGLLHRDVTPLNIMMRSLEKAVLIDFGIAKGLIPTTSTQTDKSGNRAFAPYEQIGLGSTKITVDVYTLAACLYYAVTGQLPTASMGRKLFKEELVPPQQLVPSISDRVNQAIISGMELEPEDRPQSVQEWLDLLALPPKSEASSQTATLPRNLTPLPEPSALPQSSSQKQPDEGNKLQESSPSVPPSSNSTTDATIWSLEQRIIGLILTVVALGSLAAAAIGWRFPFIAQNKLTISPEEYTKLDELLKARNWKEADRETQRIMLKVARRKNFAALDAEFLENFPCADLRNIDSRWVKYSDRRFGFSVQKRIYEQSGEDYWKLAEQVGWTGKNYDELTEKDAVVGSFPVGGKMEENGWSPIVGEILGKSTGLGIKVLSRASTCGL